MRSIRNRGDFMKMVPTTLNSDELGAIGQSIDQPLKACHFYIYESRPRQTSPVYCPRHQNPCSNAAPFCNPNYQ